jgi:hypothetical protein
MMKYHSVYSNKTKMKIYVLGNEDVEMDKRALAAAEKLKHFEKINFIFIKPNEDLPPEKILTLIDTVVGISGVTLLTEKDVDKIINSPRGSAHDYDLGFQLKYLMKIGKLERVNIIGLPAEGKINYNLVQSILRKLVAQDMQGS